MVSWNETNNDENLSYSKHGKKERHNKKIIDRLRHHGNENQSVWDWVFQILTYAYNSQFKISTSTTLVSLVLSREPLSPIIPS